jgi:hypothetical protein
LSGQILWAIDWQDNKYLIDIKLRKQEIEEQYENTIELWNRAKKYGANWCDIGVEIDGQQSLHLIALDKYAIRKKAYITFAKQIAVSGKKVTWKGIRSRSSGGDKLWRLRLIAPEFEKGKVFFNKDLKEYNLDMKELLEELKMCTQLEIKSMRDDGLDCISQLALMETYAPPKPVKAKDSYNNKIKVKPDDIYNTASLYYDEDDENSYF